MHDMTAANLRSAFGGESMAHMRYKIWGDLAEKEGFANVARLFRAVATAEQAHATGHFKAMSHVGGAFNVFAGAGFGLTNTSDALAGAIGGEVFEINEMYPTYLEVARFQGEKGAIKSMEYAVMAERIHAELYKKAKKAVDSKKDMELGPVRICKVCGHTIEGGIPDKCPICSAKSEFFVSFE
ncbi:MAG: rubrerythrin family protein [Planctomycetes bacterium]|nr:rubrerythrin family protein [Planctomycetota bacterium]